MGSSRKISPTPSRAQPAPDIQTPGWSVYDSDEDSDGEACSTIPPFDTSESNYVRLHQERADYERRRWQKSEVPMPTPRRKSSKTLKPIFPTPQECAYYLHTALESIANSNRRKFQKRQQFPAEQKTIIGALGNVEEVLGAQIKHLGQLLAVTSQNSTKGKRIPLRSSTDKGYSTPCATSVQSVTNLLCQISATLAAHARPILIELTEVAKQLDPTFRPNVSELNFTTLNKHFNPESVTQKSNGRSSKRADNRSTFHTNGPPSNSEPSMADLAAEIRRLIPEQYTFLKANYALNPDYRLEGTNRSLVEIAASCEAPEKFRPRTPSPPPPVETAKRQRAQGIPTKPTVAKVSRKGKRTRLTAVTPNGHLHHTPSSTIASNRYSIQTSQTKRPKQEPVTITLPATPFVRRPTPPSSRATPIASDLHESRRCSSSASIPRSVRREQDLGTAGPSYPVPPRRSSDHRSAMKHASLAPVVFRLPSDARQKLRENVKRRLPHVRTEEDEYEMRAYEIEDEDDEESDDSHSSLSHSVSESPLTTEIQKGSGRGNTTQCIKFHQVVDVDEPEVIEQPTVVDLDA